MKDRAGYYTYITHRVEWVAEIGYADGGGMGNIEGPIESKSFPTKEEAEKWLSDNGWAWNEHLLRLHKPGNPYGIARVRRQLAERVRWHESEELGL